MGSGQNQGIILEDGGLLVLQLLFLGFLILLNAFFASSEVALISLAPATLRKLEAEGSRRGRRLKRLLKNSGRFLATVQVGVTFAGFMASAFAAESFSDPIAAFLYEHGFAFLGKSALDGIIVVAITLVLSYVSLVFGELIPKQLGLRYAETVALYAAGPIEMFAKLTAPFVWILNASVNCVLKIFGGAFHDSRQVTEEEIRMMVDLGEENGTIESDEKRMIENVFEFNNITAGEVMTHRTEVVALDIDAPPEEVESVLLHCGFSRVPVYRGEIDQIVGFLHFREYLIARLRGETPPGLNELLKPVYLAPASMRANVLFRNLQSKKFGMAVILDEFGGTSGIVTIEDLLEEIVGSLYDEYDDADAEMEKLSENEWRIDGAMRVDEISRLLELTFPREEEFDTIGGLVFGHLDAVPTVGAVVELTDSGIVIRVESVEERRVDKVILQYTPKSEPEEVEA